MANRIPEELFPLINQMTNWQRHQWAKAGYPIDEQSVRRFLDLKKA